MIRPYSAAAVESANPESTRQLNPIDTENLLSAYAIQTPLQGLARTEEEAISLFRKIGSPVALKVVRADIVHKSEHQGVKLGINDEVELKNSFKKMYVDFRESSTTKLDGILVQKMLMGSPELIFGAKRDEIFGVTLLFGIGGLQTEVYHDVALCVEPWNDKDLEHMIYAITGTPLLRGYRGTKPVETARLLLMLKSLGRLMFDNTEIVGVDLNPVIPVPQGELIALDAKIFRSRTPITDVSEDPLVGSEVFSRIFAPESIAVIGASDNPRKIAGMILPWILKYGFDKEKIFPVNPNHKSIMGLRCYSNLDEIRDTIDLSCIVVPSHSMENVIDQVCKKGVKALIILSTQLDEANKEKLQKHGIRFCGPNSEGLICPSSKTCITFSGRFASFPVMPNGGSALVSQSGGVMTFVACTLLERGLGFSKMVSIGNAVDLDTPDYLNFLSTDSDTKAIGVYLEGVKNGPKFVKALKRLLQTKKPLVVLKSGKSEKGALVAKLHTGALAGTYATYKAVFRQHGVIEAEDIEEIADYLMAFNLQRIPKGDRLVVVSGTGGANTMISDWCQEKGVSLVEFSQERKDELKRILPEFADPTNPIDLTAQPMNDPTIIPKILKSVSNDADIYLFVMIGDVSTAREYVKACEPLVTNGKTVITCWQTSRMTGEEPRRVLLENNLPAYPTPLTAFKVLDAMISYGRFVSEKGNVNS